VLSARVLNIENPAIVPPSQRVNLNDILKSKYGAKYANHPQMMSLMDLNGGRPKGFLDGQQEASAFQDGAYIGMHQSTLAKVGFFISVIRKMLNGKLDHSPIRLNRFAIKCDRERMVYSIA
jgi:hypothetical protein